MHQILSANRTGAMFDVCERLAPFRAVSVHTIPDSPWWEGGGGNPGFLSVCLFCYFVGRLTEVSFRRFVSASSVF